MQFLQCVISGLLIGGMYALLTVGFSLTWGVMKVLNISHAAFGILGAYIAYWLLQRAHIDPLVSLIVIIPLLFILGVAVYLLLIKPITKAKEIGMASMVVTFGLTIIMENAMSYAWKPDPRVIRTSYIGSSLFLGNIALPYGSLIAFTVAIAGIALIYLFLHHTYTGKAVQATWQEPEGAALSGVNTSRTSLIAFGLSIASAGVGGVAMTFVYAFYPQLQMSWLIFIFIIAILGGLGSIVGVLVAGLVMGFIIGVSGAFLPFAWVNLILFALLLVILVVRPTGISRA